MDVLANGNYQDNKTNGSPNMFDHYLQMITTMNFNVMHLVEKQFYMNMHIIRLDVGLSGRLCKQKNKRSIVVRGY